MINIDITYLDTIKGDQKYLDLVKISTAKGVFVIKVMNGVLVIGPAF